MKSLIGMIFLAIASTAGVARAEGVPALGALAPRIEIGQWLSGEIKGAGPFAGKTVILEFFATWCRPCWAAVPHMNELVAKFANDNIVFISMTHEKAEDIASRIGMMGIKSRVAVDHDGATHEAFGIESIPYLVLIDQNGFIRWQGHPMAFSADQLAAFLKSVGVK